MTGPKRPSQSFFSSLGDLLKAALRKKGVPVPDQGATRSEPAIVANSEPKPVPATRPPASVPHSSTRQSQERGNQRSSPPPGALPKRHHPPGRRTAAPPPPRTAQAGKASGGSARPVATPVERPDASNASVDPAQQQRRTEEATRAILQQRIAKLPEFIEERERTAAARCRPQPAEREDLAKRLDVGTSSMLTIAGSRLTDVVLGIDFGTSSTKIVARMPYEAGDPCYAIAAPDFAQAENHPHLWASRLWLTPDGRFSLAPEPGANAVCGIKASLMKPLADRAMILHCEGHGATAMEVATAFLALQIRQARGWLFQAHQREFARRSLRWSYNVGFPAAALNETEMARHYQVTVGAAIALSSVKGSLDIGVVRGAVSHASAGEDALRALNASLQPEIAAAVAGFARSRRREDGLYAMVDVGAGTLDCCTFSLIEAKEEDRCPIFMASVSMHGVEPARMCSGDAALEQQFRKEVDLVQRQVIWTTRLRRDPNSPRWRTGLPLFLVGGGSQSAVHLASTTALDRWLRGASKKGGVTVLELPEPSELVHRAGGESHRLAVAVGLSLPAQDIPIVQLPWMIEDFYTPRHRDYSDRYIEK